MSAPDTPHFVPTIGDEVPRRAWVRFALLVTLFAAVLAVAIFTDLRDRISHEGFRSAMRDAGLWAPVAVLALFTARPLVLFPLSTLWIASGAFFGWFEGWLWATVGTVLGAVVGFTVARRLGREFIERRLGSRLGRWTRMDDHAFRTLLLLKFNPAVPDDLINNLAGVSRVSYGVFALATVLGTAPIILIYTYIGTTVWEFPSPSFWIAAGVLTAVTVILLFWNRIAGLWRSRTRNGGETR